MLQTQTKDLFSFHNFACILDMKYYLTFLKWNNCFSKLRGRLRIPPWAFWSIGDIRGVVVKPFALYSRGHGFTKVPRGIIVKATELRALERYSWLAAYGSVETGRVHMGYPEFNKVNPLHILNHLSDHIKFRSIQPQPVAWKINIAEDVRHLIRL